MTCIFSDSRPAPPPYINDESDPIESYQPRTDVSNHHDDDEGTYLV